jgi:L-malate glycosyltransferase
MAIRVLYCIESMVHGGTEKQLGMLINNIDRARVEPFLCTLKPSTMDLGMLDCESIELGFRTFRSPAALGAIRRLRRFMMSRRIDLVQTFFQDPTLIGLLGSARTAVRSRVATFRDMGFWRTPAKVAQLRFAYRFFDGFIANSEAVAAQVHRLDGIALTDIEVIPNGIAVDASALADRTRNAVPVVGVVANLDRPVKRVDLFINAAALVHRAAAGRVRFVVAGDGHLRPALEERARQLGLSGAIQFLGNVPDVRTHLRRFDVGVLCSDSEGMSNAILEYMAEGVPTVVRNVGGNAELVAEGETGLLVEDDQAESIAGRIVELLREPQRAGAIAANAHAMVMERFSISAHVRRHERYYLARVKGVRGRVPTAGIGKYGCVTD